MKNLTFLSSRLLFTFLITICLFSLAYAGGSSHPSSGFGLAAQIKPKTVESLSGNIGANDPCRKSPYIYKTVTCESGTSRLKACIKKTSNNNNAPNVTIQLKALRGIWNQSAVITDTTNGNEDCNSHTVSLSKGAGNYILIIKGASCGISHFDASIECEGNPASTQLTQ